MSSILKAITSDNFRDSFKDVFSIEKLPLGNIQNAVRLIKELQNRIGKNFKVTRRLPELSVAETKIFKSKKEAKKQFDEWLK